MTRAQTFDYAGAKQAGYSDEEILTELSSKYPNYDVQAAQESGHSIQDINQYLSEYKPERSIPEKALRVGAQIGIGAAQAHPLGMAYELGTEYLKHPESLQIPYRENIMEEIESLADRKVASQMGWGEWSEDDESHLKMLENQFLNPNEAMKHVVPVDIGIRGLIEKATGQDLSPEGVLEHGANWLGFIKKWTNPKELLKIGLKPKELIQAISPSGTELFRSGLVGATLEMAEQGNFGPIGTVASTVLADAVGHLPQALKYAVTHPKEVLAGAVNLFTQANSKNAWTNDLVKSANEMGIQLDAGTLTNNNLIRMLQARAAQSGLAGEALDNFRKELSDQITRKYQDILGDLGNIAFETEHQAGEAVRNFVHNEERNLFEKYGIRPDRESPSLQGRISLEPEVDIAREIERDILDSIYAGPLESSSEAGRNIKTTAENIKKPIKENFRDRWTDMNRSVKALPPAEEENLGRAISTFVNEHEGSLLLGESSAEARVLNAAKKLQGELFEEIELEATKAAKKGKKPGNVKVAKPKKVSLDSLIKTKRTLADVADYEFGGSNFESAYKHLVGELDQAIESRLGEFSEELYNQYHQLKSEYSAYKDTFENRNVLPVFAPKNRNYNNMFTEYVRNPDKLRSLENVMNLDESGMNVISQIKRDMAQRILSRPNITQRQARDLIQILGREYEEPIMELLAARQMNQPRTPMPRRMEGVGLRPEAPRIPGGAQPKPIGGRGIPKAEHARQKLYEFIKNKDSAQIMKIFDSVEGIQRLRRSLSLTDEGKDLFDKLSRYKLYEMIDKKMTDAVNENLKLGTFSNLLKNTKSEAIVRELIGDEAFKQLKKLQSITGKMQSSFDKFYNASKSGVTVTDVALASNAVMGLFTGNPFQLMISGGSIGSLRLGAYLLSDPVFLKYLEKAVITKDPIKFIELLKQMQPRVDKAILTALQDEND